MKLFAAALAILGVVLVIFSVATYRELQATAKSPSIPTPESMPLLKLVGPELFVSPEDGAVPPKPGQLASVVSRRIYGLGGVGLLFVAGAVVIVMKQPRERA